MISPKFLYAVSKKRFRVKTEQQKSEFIASPQVLYQWDAYQWDAYRLWPHLAQTTQFQFNSCSFQQMYPNGLFNKKLKGMKNSFLNSACSIDNPYLYRNPLFNFLYEGNDIFLNIPHAELIVHITIVSSTSCMKRMKHHLPVSRMQHCWSNSTLTKVN